MQTLIHFNNFVKEINENNGRLYKQSVLNKYANRRTYIKYALQTSAANDAY